MSTSSWNWPRLGKLMKNSQSFFIFHKDKSNFKTHVNVYLIKWTPNNLLGLKQKMCKYIQKYK